MSKAGWVGIDVAKETFYAAVADETAIPREWASLPVAAFEHSDRGVSEFLRWLRALGWSKGNITGVCIEATGRYAQQWVEQLKQRLGPVCVVNPARPKAYAQSLGIRDKSDRVDACVIALYAKATCPEPRPVRSPQQRELRELSRLHNALQKQCQANRQRLSEAPAFALVRTSLKKMIAAAQRQMEQLEQAMEQLIRNDNILSMDLKRAVTVKGIGSRTATLILAEFGDLRHYNRDELVALAGLYPREYTSGTSVHKKSRLAKAGKESVRAALYMCAMSAIQANPPLANFAQRLQANGKEPMQAIAAVMRKLLLLVRAVIVTGVDYDANYAKVLQWQAA